MSDGHPYNYSRNVGSVVRPMHNNSDDSSDFQISESIREGILETPEPTNDETTISTEEKRKTKKGGN